MGYFHNKYYKEATFQSLTVERGNGVSKYIITVWAISAVMLAITGCDSSGSRLSDATGRVADKTTILATLHENAVQQTVLPSLGMGLHAPQESSFKPLFSKNGGGVAYSAEKNGKVYVVHNGSPGTLYETVGEIVLSPDGRRIAYGALSEGKWRMVIDGTEGVPYSTVKSPLFSPDGSHLAYQALSGEKWHLVVDTTANGGTQTRLMDHQFSADSRTIAYIDNADAYSRRGRLVLSDLAFVQQKVISSNAFRFTLNPDGSRIAAISRRENKQYVVTCRIDRPNDVQNGSEYSVIDNLAFGPDGIALTYVAARDGVRFMVFNGREEVLPNGGSPVEAHVVRPDQKGVGAIISANNQTFFHQFFLDGGKKDSVYDEAGGLTYDGGGDAYAYAARRGNAWFIVVNGVEGPGFDRVISPEFSPNGKYLVYRARKDGKRFVVVAKRSGKIIRQHPAYEQVFEVTFTADGKSLAYGVKDGARLIWQVEPL